MSIITETDRLIIREIQPGDADDLFEMDADPEVHRYIENKPVDSLEKIGAIIKMIGEQYRRFGTARLAVVAKSNNECIGWAGLKFFESSVNGHSNFYELGYRLKRKHWGKGFATEASQAVLKAGFEKFSPPAIFAMTHPENSSSQNVLRKLGFKHKGQFDYEGDLTDWFELKKETFQSNMGEEDQCFH